MSALSPPARIGRDLALIRRTTGNFVFLAGCGPLGAAAGNGYKTRIPVFVEIGFEVSE